MASSAWAIVRAREKAEKSLGAKFNIRAFYDAVLELGSVPLPVVTARIDRFITEHGKGPLPGYRVSRGAHAARVLVSAAPPKHIFIS